MRLPYVGLNARLPLAASAALLLFGASCGTSNLGSQVKPDAPTAGEALGGGALNCKQGAYAEPLVVDLPADKRVDLEAQMNGGVALIRYDCSDIQVIKDCRLSGSYAFAGVSLKEQVISLQNQDELRANLPFSSGAVSAELEQGSQLDLALVMVGKRSTAARVERPVLEGSQCGDATHFVRAATVGAFAMKTGTKGRVAATVELFGAGVSGKSSAEEKRVNKDGDLVACKASKVSAEAPPDQCQSAIRVELVPIPTKLPQAAAAKAAAGDKPAEREVKVIDSPCAAEGFVFADGKCTRAGTSAAPHLCDPANSDDCKAQCDAGHMGSCHNYAEAVFVNFCNDPSKKKVCDETISSENEAREREALKLWRKACEEGSVPDACAEAGDYHLQTTGGQKPDFAVATASLEKGCDLGKAESCTTLAGVYLAGKAGLKKDTTRGLGLMDRACRLGEQYACQELGSFYFAGKHLARDPARGYEYLSQFCAQGAYDTCFELGEHLLGIFGRYEDEFTGARPVEKVPNADKLGRELLERACGAGELTDACGRLGRLYYLEQNWTLARKFLSSGCKSDGEICVLAAELELEGKGGPKDKSAALEYWVVSADDDYRYRAAQAWEKGDGVPKNVERATKLYAGLCSGELRKACADAKRLDRGLWLEALELDCGKEDEWSCGELRAADRAKHAVQIEKLCASSVEYGCVELKKLDQAKAKTLLTASCEREQADRGDEDKDSCKLLKSLF